MKPTPVKPVRLVDVSDIGRISKKSKKPKTQEVAAKDIPAAGTRRQRKAWMELNDRLSKLTQLYDWLSALYDLMIMPQYAQVKYTLYSQKSGKPLQFSWVPDKKSAIRQFVYHGQHDTKFTMEIITELDELMKQLEREKMPILYTTPYKDSVDTATVRRIVVYRDYIQTGGGHNDSATYAYALVFAPICAEYEVLSGN